MTLEKADRATPEPRPAPPGTHASAALGTLARVGSLVVAWVVAVTTLDCGAPAASRAPKAPAAATAGSAMAPSPDCLPIKAPDVHDPSYEETDSYAEEVASRGQPARLCAPGSTQRTIACGYARCQAETQACQYRTIYDDGTPGWACINVDEPRAPPHGPFFECDDASDCRGALACCIAFEDHDNPSMTRALCTARRGPGSQCATELCDNGGVACPPGQTCRNGECRLQQEPRAHCGALGRCSADRPECIWDGRGPRCVTKSEAYDFTSPSSFFQDESMAAHECARPTDCGSGWECCTHHDKPAKLTYCSAQCDLGLSTAVCESRDDCLSICERLAPAERATCLARTQCTTIKAGVKACLDLS